MSLRGDPRLLFSQYKFEFPPATKYAASVPMKNICFHAALVVAVRWLRLAPVLLSCFCLGPFLHAQPAPTNAPAKLETATFGGGCFWCAQAVFQRIPGVKSVVSGFAGGTTENPTYEDVCTGTTGHAEVIQLKFDPAIISYNKLLEIFWEAHDPTTLNRQGADTGTQYRSIILYSDEEQKAAAEKSKAEAQPHFHSPIVTQIVPLKAFYSAEAHHQNYYNLNRNESYCQFVIGPKLHKLIAKGVIPQEKEN
jgi:peptide-methionine (S)-S-oxide reductase